MSEESAKECILSWAGIAYTVDAMVNCIVKLEWQFDSILAIARGGLVPAAMLGHRLAINRVHSIALQSYGEDNKPLLLVRALSQMTAEGLNSPKLLIVDDIVDTGRTLATVKKMVPRAKSAAIIMRTTVPLELQPDLYGGTVAPSTWVRFPWEEKKKPN